MARPIIGSSETLEPDLVPTLISDKSWRDLALEPGREELDSLLIGYLQRRQIYGVNVGIAAAHVEGAISFTSDGSDVSLLIVKVEFEAGEPETVALTLTLVQEDHVDTLLAPVGRVGFVHVRGERPGVVCDSLSVPERCAAALRAIGGRRVIRAGPGEFACVPLPGFNSLGEVPPAELTPVLRQSERGNVSIQFSERFVLKLFRRLEEGTSPTLEIGRF